MNNTISLSQLITRLAEVSGVDNNTARRYLRVFFETITEGLKNNESVIIKNVGTFSVAEDLNGEGRKVSFAPDASLAQELNRPFEMFEAVELADDVDFSDVKLPEIENAPDVTVPDPEIVTEAKSSVVTEPDPEVVTVTEVIPEPEAVIEPATEPEPETEHVQIPQYERPVSNTPPRAHSHYNGHRHDYHRQSSTKYIIWCCAGVVAVGIIAYIAAVVLTPITPPEDYDTSPLFAPAATEGIPTISVEEINAPAVTESQSEGATSPTASTPAVSVQESLDVETPATEPVFDTVTASLSQLARKHYGEKIFWVYIFEANRDKISNPNQIRPGTKVLIPDRNTFPGKDESEARELAKKRQSEILAKF